MKTREQIINELESCETGKSLGPEIYALQEMLVKEGKGDPQVLEAIFTYLLSPDYNLNASTAVSSYLIHFAGVGEQEKKTVFDRLFTALKTRWEPVRVWTSLLHELLVRSLQGNKHLFPPLDEFVSLITYIGEHAPEIDEGYACTGSVLGKLIRISIIVDKPSEPLQEAGLEYLKAIVRHPMPPSYNCGCYYHVIDPWLRPPKYLTEECLPYVVDLMEHGLIKTSPSEIEECRKNIIPFENLPGFNIAASALELLLEFPGQIETIVSLIRDKQLGEDERWCFAEVSKKFKQNDILLQLLEKLCGSSSDFNQPALLLKEIRDPEKEPPEHLTYDIVLGSIVPEETPHRLFPDYDEVFTETIPDTIRQKFIPVLTFQLNSINPSWQGQAHFLYHETTASDEIRFRISKNGLIEHLEANIPPINEFHSNSQWEDPLALEDTLNRLRGERKYLQIEHKTIEDEPPPLEDVMLMNDWVDYLEDDLESRGNVLERFLYPNWAQYGDIPNHGGKPMQFIAELSASNLGLCDFYYYLFFDPDSNCFCQLMQFT